ncbi:hypothetical protein JTB14_037793 [Gonioctena quinquepunctata]|nr:hypothetical protein JTB14_037793 [Gonioctena quinquepunctata]
MAAESRKAETVGLHGVRQAKIAGDKGDTSLVDLPPPLPRALERDKHYNNRPPQSDYPKHHTKHPLNHTLIKRSQPHQYHTNTNNHSTNHPHNNSSSYKSIF